MKKNEYTVEIANQKITVFATDHNEAVREAFKKETGKVKILGPLVTCLKKGDKPKDEMFYNVNYLIEKGYLADFEINKIDDLPSKKVLVFDDIKKE